LFSPENNRPAGQKKGERRRRDNRQDSIKKEKYFG
jgi:hypothetical protein